MGAFIPLQHILQHLFSHFRMAIDYFPSSKRKKTVISCLIDQGLGGVNHPLTPSFRQGKDPPLAYWERIELFRCSLLAAPDMSFGQLHVKVRSFSLCSEDSGNFLIQPRHLLLSIFTCCFQASTGSFDSRECSKISSQSFPSPVGQEAPEIFSPIFRLRPR